MQKLPLMVATVVCTWRRVHHTMALTACWTAGVAGLSAALPAALAPAEAAPIPQIAVDMDSGIEFDFVLNADVVESDMDEDDESDSYSGDTDDG